MNIGPEKRKESVIWGKGKEGKTGRTPHFSGKRADRLQALYAKIVGPGEISKYRGGKGQKRGPRRGNGVAFFLGRVTVRPS